ncbi:ATP-binding protein [Streptomyces sp. NPDC004539]|uniref:ATP-binding protein n=1 Tax=Streptomyces sp. NPDC004539 TaxID=3154280 RepID=UPI0033A90D72
MFPSPTHHMRWCFARHRRAASQARFFFREQATAWKLPDDVVDNAVLLLSELMTNAYRHAKVPGREVHAHAVLHDDVLRVAVEDADNTLPTPRDAGPLDESGRGLALVAAIADKWGAEPRPYGIGKAVWFEMRMPTGPACPPERE